MAAATSGRKTPQMIGAAKNFPMNYPGKANEILVAGCMAMVDASGRAVNAATATGAIGAGRVKTQGGLDRWDLTGLADGALKVEVEEGIFKYFNSTAGDLITVADIGKKCWIADNQTVAKTSATNTRSPAGVIRQVDSDGVFVEFSVTATAQATV
jgi:hypothetical protein